MTETVVSSATREVVIGFDRPFVIIGERINPTGRKLLAAEMSAGDFSRVEADARAQVEAGAHMLDVNAGIPLADEPAILAKAIQLVQSITDVPLSIDSSIVAALEAGLAVYKGKALVNSVTGEEERMEAVLPLIKKYGAAVVAISNDETGISEDPDVRFAVAKTHRRARGRPRHPGERHRRRSARDADRRDQPGRRAGDAASPAPARGAEGQHDLRRVEHQLRPAESRRHQQRIPDNGDRVGPHFRDHQSDARRDRPGLPRRGRHDGPRPGLRALDQPVPRSAARRRGRRSLPRPARSAGTKAACVQARAQRARARSSSSRRPASAGDSRSARRSCRRRARSASTSIRSAAGAESAGAARCVIAEGEFAKHGVRSGAASVSAVGEVEERYASRRGLPAGHRLSCSTLVQGDVVVDVPPGQPGASPGRAQGCRCARNRAESGRPPALRRSAGAGHAGSVRRPAAPDERAREGMAAHRARLRSFGAARIAARAAQGPVESDRGGARRVSQIIAVWPGFHDKAFGMAVDVGSTTVAAHLCDLESGELVAASRHR